MKKTLNIILAWTFGSFNAFALALLFFFQPDHDLEKSAGGCAVCGVGGIIYLAIIAFFILTMWKIFVKAGKPGWAAIVPIYNLYILTEINGRPPVWLVIYWIVGFIMIPLDLAKSFGKETGFAIGMIFLPIIFYPILAFGSDEYKGPLGAAPTTPAV